MAHKGFTSTTNRATALLGLCVLLLAYGWWMPAAHAEPLQQAPVNDNFANALTIVALPYSDTQNTTAATTEGNDPRLPCIANNPTTNWRQGWHSAWYAYTAPANGVLHVDTLGSDFDTVLGIWTGVWGSLTNVGCHDDVSWPGTPQSSLDILVVSGTTYYIEAVGYRSTSSGNLVLSANSVTPPANDDFDNPFLISATPYTYTQSTAIATTAPDDPVLSCASGGQESHSVWYRFVAPGDGTLHLDTNGSGYDTALAVWTGSRGSLSEAACDDDSGPGLLSSLDLAVTAGSTYHIEIVSYGSTSGGPLTLNADFATVKPLYLHHLTAPVTVVNGSNTTEIMDRQPVWGGTATAPINNTWYFFYLYPGLAEALTLQGTIRIPLYIEANNNFNANFRARVWDLPPVGTSTSVGTALVSVPAGSDGWYTLSIPNVNYTAAQGHALVLGVRSSRPVNLYYDSATYNSRLELPVTTYVDVEQVSTRSACHPGGTSLFSQGQAMTMTARVADPFGSYDIAGADIEIADPGGAPVMPGVAMTPVVTATGAITYEYGHTIPTTATLGTYTAVVTGTESNGVQATATVTFTVQSPALLTGTLSAVPVVTNTGQVIVVTMLISNAGQAAATGVAPSALTMGGSGGATLASGPSPPSADITAGETVTFTWLYTATNFGTLNWTGNVTGTDANSCALVTSPATTSNDVLVLPPYQLEVGTAAVGNGWTTIDLANTYSDMVVVCTPQYASNSIPIVPRVRNASGSSFEVRLQSPSSGTPVADTIHYIVMETGAFTLPNGTRIEAQKYNSTVTDGRNSSWTGEVQSYLQSYTNPVVLGQVMSYNDSDFSAFWGRGSSAANPPNASNLWTGKMVSKDTDTTRANETVGFIVIEAGHGDLFGVEYEARLGEDIVLSVVDSPPYTYNYGQPFSTPPQIGLVSKAAEDGGDGAWAYLYGANPFTASTIDVALDEDAIGGASRSHPANEQVAYLVFEGPLAIGPDPFLEISKELLQEGSSSMILPGDTLTYTVSYANYGLIPATNVVMTDQLPADVIFASAPGCAHDGSPTDGVVTCTLGTLGSFDIGAITITVTADPNLITNTVLVNSATVASTEGVSATATITNLVTAFSLFKMETLTATVDHNWTTVVLNNVYNDMVVVCTPQYANNAVPLVTRVRNASKSSFEVRIQTPHATDPNVALNAETVHCLAIDAGQAVLPDGRKIEAQKYNSTVTDENNSWVGEAQTYLHAYSNPVVLGQIMSYNDYDWSAFWDRGASRTDPPDASTLYTGKTVCEDSDVTRAAETVGFIIVEQGYGDIGSVAYEAWLGADTVQGVGDSPPYSYFFQRAFAAAPKIALASLSGVDGGNGGWSILYGANPLGPNTIDLAIDEDQLGDSERNHITEQVAYLVFEEPLTVRPTHDLLISKADTPDPVSVGQPLAYTIIYTNTGVLTTTNVVITETYDSNVSFALATPPPDVGNNVWHIGDVGPGETGTLVVTVTVNGGLPNGAVLTNTVTIDSHQTNPITDTETTQVRSFALSLTKSDSPDPVTAGSTLTYTLTYVNAGAAAAPDVTITDTLPAGVTYGGVVSQPPGWSDPPTFTPGPPDTLAWYTPTLPAGASGSIVFTMTGDAAASGTITNSAVITSSLPDDNPNDNIADEPTTVIPLAVTVGFSSASYSVGEDAGPAVITVTLSATPALTVTVDYASSDGTAVAGSDYTAISNTLTFAPGVTSQTFGVPITPDTLDENDETVWLTLSNPSNATISGANPATLTILDDDPTPTVSFSSATYSVGESGGTATIDVTLSAASSLTVTVNYATSDGTAVAGTDYTASGGGLTFAPGVTSRSFGVPILLDALDENDETVLLTLSAAINATIGGANPATLSILDDDPPPTVQFSSGSYSVDEGVGTATINVVLSAVSGLTVTVNYATSDGTAVAGSDYAATGGSLFFAPGVTSQSFGVSITDDSQNEPDETIVLTLSFANNAVIGGVNPATLFIIDNDAVPGQVTIDKFVSPSTVTTPGQPVTYTYTITIYNAGPSTVRVAQITDTLPAGFTYITTTATSGVGYPDSIVTNTQTIIWSYNLPRPTIAGGSNATLTFLATSSNEGGTYCNSAGVDIVGSIGLVARGDLACVNISWPIFEIESHVGNTTIRVRVRMEPSGPVILSWEILP